MRVEDRAAFEHGAGDGEQSVSDGAESASMTVAAGSETGLAVQEVAYAGLDALRTAVELDLCAYLHAVPGLGPNRLDRPFAPLIN